MSHFLKNRCNKTFQNIIETYKDPNLSNSVNQLNLALFNHQKKLIENNCNELLKKLGEEKNKEIQSLTARVEELTKKDINLEDLNRTISDLRRELDEKTRAEDAIKTKIHNMKKKLEVQKKKIDEEMKQKNENIQRLEQENKQLSEESKRKLEEQRNRIFQEKEQALKEMADGMKITREKFNQQLSKLAKDHKSKLEQLNKDNSRLVDELDRLKREKSVVSESTNQTIKEKEEECKKQIEEIRSEITKINEKCQKEIEEIQKDYETRLIESGQGIERIRNEMDELTEKYKKDLTETDNRYKKLFKRQEEDYGNRLKDCKSRYDETFSTNIELNKLIDKKKKIEQEKKECDEKLKEQVNLDQKKKQFEEQLKIIFRNLYVEVRKTLTYQCTISNDYMDLFEGEYKLEPETKRPPKSQGQLPQPPSKINYTKTTLKEFVLKHKDKFYLEKIYAKSVTGKDCNDINCCYELWFKVKLLRTNINYYIHFKPQNNKIRFWQLFGSAMIDLSGTVVIYDRNDLGIPEKTSGPFGILDGGFSSNSLYYNKYLKYKTKYTNKKMELSNK